MGTSASKVSNAYYNNYTITGNNNGLSSGEQRIGSAASSSTTDVSPRTDLNYSTSINPSWVGRLTNIGKGVYNKIEGTIGNNTDLIQTVKHVGASAVRMAMGDRNEIQRVTNLVNDFLDSSTPEGVLTSSEQVDFNKISDIVETQIRSVNNMHDAHDAYQTLALGMTGMRNIEVSTEPTEQSLSGVMVRATPIEMNRKESILEVAGPRLGVIPRGSNSPPSDYLINSFDNAITKYGRLGQLKFKANQIHELQQSILFSVLHNSANNLCTSGYLRPFSIESNLFIGNLNQVSVPFTAAPYPDGHLFSPSDLLMPSVNIIDATTGQSMNRKIALSSYAYTIPFSDQTREVRVVLSGQVVITNQPYDENSPVMLGFLFRRGGVYYFSKAILINNNSNIKDKEVTAIKSYGSNVRTFTSYQNTLSNKYITSITNDYTKLMINDPTGVYTRSKLINTDSETLVKERQDAISGNNNLSDSVVRFSYSSQWQVVTNLSNCEEINANDVFSTGLQNWDSSLKFRAALVAVYNESMNMSVSVFSPSISITTVRMPTEMRYQGNPHFGTVLDKMGIVPDWYTTADKHDPWYIYRDVVSPFINYAGRIASVHIKSGAPYQLTRMHVEEARVNSGLPALTDDQMEAHIMILITDISKWMSDAGPVSSYSPRDRIGMFMHICEKVMFQSITHIKVFADEIGILSSTYLSDCNEFNSIESKLEKKMLGS